MPLGCAAVNSGSRAADTFRMVQPTLSSSHDLSSVLTKREIRGIEFNDRHPWAPFLVLAAIWVLTVGAILYEFSVLLSHGDSFGLATWPDLWSFVNGWRDAQGPFHRYHLLVLETVDEAVFEVAFALLLSVFLLITQLQNRLIRKLRDALRERS